MSTEISLIKENAFEAIYNANIVDTPTEVVFQRFENKWFIIITQYEKMSNLYTVQFDKKEDLSTMQELGGLHTIPLTITCNFGHDTDEIQSAIQFLVNNSSLKNCNTEILISLGLQTINGKILKELALVLNKIIK